MLRNFKCLYHIQYHKWKSCSGKQELKNVVVKKIKTTLNIRYFALWKVETGLDLPLFSFGTSTMRFIASALKNIRNAFFVFLYFHKFSMPQHTKLLMFKKKKKKNYPGSHSNFRFPLIVPSPSSLSNLSSKSQT